MTTPPVTIVIPVSKSAPTLDACLRAVLRHTDYPDWQIIVVDDGGALELAADLATTQNLQMMRGSAGGVAQALNAGFAVAAGRDIVRLHADVVIETSGWLNLLVEAAYAVSRTAAVGVRLVFPDGRIQSEGRNLLSGFGFHARHVNRKAFQSESIGGKCAEVDSVSGALAYYRRAPLDEIGGLDEGYGPAWFEDDDYCFSARQLNYRVWVEPAVRAVHYSRSMPPTFILPPGMRENVILPLIRGFKENALKLQADRWLAKWGWHPFYPDLSEVRRLYGDTEVCWQIGERLRFKPSSATPLVDCCIATWNSLPYLRRTLESLTTVDYPAACVRVYVTNNGSTDGTAEYLAALKASYPFELTVIDVPVNTGVAPGLNLAISAGQGELVARLDDDIVLPRDWISVMLRDLVQRPFAGVVGLKALRDDDRRAIQWAGEVAYPRLHSHADEPNAGQADVLWRAWRVPGCCNLYRRDVLDRCGLIDIRYSPSQGDDHDHGATLMAAGYEVLCEGRTHVLHKCNSGLDSSWAGMASIHANGQKILGKWGEDALHQLDNTLVLSREGRCLPPDGDTSGWMNRGPSPDEFPRREASLGAEVSQMVRQLYEAQSAPIPVGTQLHALADQFLTRARVLSGDREFREAVNVILMMVNFAPTRLEGYQHLAAAYREVGQSGLARTAAKRGLNLYPQDSVLRDLAETTAEQIASRERAVIAAIHAQALPAIGGDSSARWSTSSTPRILLVKTYQGNDTNEDQGYLAEFRRRLTVAGVYAEIRAVSQPDPRGYDVVHLWGSAQPHQTLTQLKAARMLAPDTPIVLSPLLSDQTGARRLGQIASAVFNRPAAQWEMGLNEFAEGKLVLSGEKGPEIARMGILAEHTGLVRRQLFQLADQIMTFTAGEGDVIERLSGVTLNRIELPSGGSRPEAAGASPDLFARRYGLRDFVLMVGPLVPERNQLQTLFALQTGYTPVVVVGPQPDPSYLATCRKVAPKGSLFLDELPREMLLSAYKAARIFVAAGWVESFCPAAYEAAFAGCSVALSEGIGERTNFGSGAYGFDPNKFATIRIAVQTAWAAHQQRAAARALWAESLAQRHDWGVIIPRAVAAYESLLTRVALISPA